MSFEKKVVLTKPPVHRSVALVPRHPGRLLVTHSAFSLVGPQFFPTAPSRPELSRAERALSSTSARGRVASQSCSDF